MAFTVEDGTGVADANALITVVQYRAHFADRGVTVTEEDAIIQGAIVRASDYIEQRWGFALLGEIEFEVQCQPFPRTGVCDRAGRELTGIPKALVKAVAEYAKIAIAQDLLSNPTVDATGRHVTLKREKVGPIEEETQYGEGGGIDIIVKPYPSADKWMRDFVLRTALSGLNGTRTRG